MALVVSLDFLNKQISITSTNGVPTTQRSPRQLLRKLADPGLSVPITIVVTPGTSRRPSSGQEMLPRRALGLAAENSPRYVPRGNLPSGSVPSVQSNGLWNVPRNGLAFRPLDAAAGRAVGSRKARVKAGRAGAGGGMIKRNTIQREKASQVVDRDAIFNV